MDAEEGRTINRTTHQRVMGLAQVYADVPTYDPISGVAARRMVDALLVQGWSLGDIASRAGLKSSTLSLANLRVLGLDSTAPQRVWQAYQQLRDVPGPHVPVQQRAMHSGYAPWWVYGPRIRDERAVPDVSGIEDLHQRNLIIMRATELHACLDCDDKRLTRGRRVLSLRSSQSVRV